MTFIHVAIDLYSGRENPAWDLTSAEAVEFLARVAALSIGQMGITVQGDALGYRGVHAQVDTGQGKVDYRMAAGVVSVEGEPDISFVLRDTDRSLEHWLLLTGRATLGSDLLAYLLEESS